MLIAATTGHTGRSTRWNDRGAVFEGREEVSIVRAYLDACDRELRRLGHTFVGMSDGSYPEQWRRADTYGAGVYVNGHANAGRGDRGEVFYDYHSSAGKSLAESVAKALATACPWPVVAKPCRPDTNSVARDGDYSEAYGCIRGVRAVAIVFEPAFIDGPQREWFFANLDAVGVALATGIDEWSKTR